MSLKIALENCEKIHDEFDRRKAAGLSLPTLQELDELLRPGSCDCYPWPDKCPYCGGQPAELAPYTTLAESEAEEIARIIWIGWDDEWTDIMQEIHAAAGRLHAMGYRKVAVPNGSQGGAA